MSQAARSFDSAVLQALRSFNLVVLEAPLSHLKRTITKPKNEKIKTVLGHLFWDQEELFSEEEKKHYKSRDTVPLSRSHSSKVNIQ